MAEVNHYNLDPTKSDDRAELELLGRELEKDCETLGESLWIEKLIELGESYEVLLNKARAHGVTPRT